MFHRYVLYVMTVTSARSLQFKGLAHYRRLSFRCRALSCLGMPAEE